MTRQTDQFEEHAYREALENADEMEGLVSPLGDRLILALVAVLFGALWWWLR